MILCVMQKFDVIFMADEILLLFPFSMKPLYLNSGAYSFTAFAGVPAMELRFTEVYFTAFI